MIINIYNEQTQKEAVNYIASLEPDKFYKVKITQKRAKRSINQNSLYWMWLTCIEQETGNEKEFLHNHFRNKYLGSETVEIFGQKQNELYSTTRLSTLLFKQYLDKIQYFASSELGIILPNPEDLQFEHFKDYYSKFL